MTRPYAEALCNESWRPSRDEEEPPTPTPPPSPQSSHGTPWAARAERICHERGCTRCGLGRTTPLPEEFAPDRLVDATCPRCFFPFREVWDEHEEYHWQEGNDMRCCDCGALWSSKVRYCLGDWCGGPVEPVDGSWHVAWRFLNSADPEQLHTEMPVFAGGRYQRDDVEVVRVPGRRQPPRHGLTTAGSSSAHAGCRADRRARQPRACQTPPPPRGHPTPSPRRPPTRLRRDRSMGGSILPTRTGTAPTGRRPGTSTGLIPLASPPNESSLNDFTSPPPRTRGGHWTGRSLAHRWDSRICPPR